MLLLVEREGSVSCLLEKGWLLEMFSAACAVCAVFVLEGKAC